MSGNICWEDIDSAIFSDGDVYDIWDEIERITQGANSLKLLINLFKREAMNATHKWKRTLMNWCALVAMWQDACVTKKKKDIIQELDTCMRQTWVQFINISKNTHTSPWNPISNPQQHKGYRSIIRHKS